MRIMLQPTNPALHLLCVGHSYSCSVDNVALRDDQGHNVVQNGDFSGAELGWTEWSFDINNPGQKAVLSDATATSEAPAGASGQFLCISGSGGVAQGGIWQELTLQTGKHYELNGVFKGFGQVSWCEVYLVTQQPDDGVDTMPTPDVHYGFQSTTYAADKAFFESLGTMALEVRADVRDWLTTTNGPSSQESGISCGCPALPRMQRAVIMVAIVLLGLTKVWVKISVVQTLHPLRLDVS